MKTDIATLIRKHFGNELSQETLSNAIALVNDIESERTKQLNLPDVRRRFKKNEIIVYKTKIPAVIKKKIANGFYIVKDQKSNDVKVYRTDIEKAKINVA